MKLDDFINENPKVLHYGTSYCLHFEAVNYLYQSIARDLFQKFWQPRRVINIYTIWSIFVHLGKNCLNRQLRLALFLCHSAVAFVLSSV